jgi:hypothetical protein
VLTAALPRKARMDLRTHLQVLWRFRLIVAAGVVLGLVLAASAVLTPSGEYRQKLVYSSGSTVYVTQPGFPEGRILAEIPDGVPNSDADSGTASASGKFFADPSRFSSLALLYSYLLTSDELERRMGGLPGNTEIIAEPVVNGTGSRATTLPLIAISVLAPSPQDAKRLNQVAIEALRAYIAEKQRANDVPDKDRVRLDVLSPPGEPEVAVGRSYTGAIVLFLLCTMLAVGLAYVLENLRPRESLDWDDADWLEAASNGAGHDADLTLEASDEHEHAGGSHRA